MALFKKALITLLLTVLACASLQAQELTVSKYVQSTNTAIEFSQILSLSPTDWKTHSKSLHSTPMGSWYKVDLPATTIEESLFLRFDNSVIDSLEFWFLESQKVVKQGMLGDTIAFSNREKISQAFVIQVPASTKEVTAYFRISSQLASFTNVQALKQRALDVQESTQNTYNALFYGFMLAMALSNLLLYITTRSRDFLLYVGYVLFSAMAIAAINGTSFFHLWPQNPVWHNKSGFIFSMLAAVCASLFTLEVLKISKDEKHHFQLLSGLAVMCAATAVLGLIFSYFWTQILSLILVAASAMSIWLVGCRKWLQGLELAKYYTLAWSMLFVSLFIVFLQSSGWLSLNLPLQHTTMVGTGLETAILAAVLAIRYSQQKKDMLEAQESALEKEIEARKAQEEVIRVQQEAQEDLEYKVEERTFELEIALKELAEKNRELEEKNTIDALTGVRNRRFFDKKYVAEFRRSRREQSELSIVMLDIDHFKSVNDTYGHLVGDECIKFVATVAKNQLKRTADDVCRYGGEEFALILPNTNSEGAFAIAESIRHFIENQTVPTPAGDLELRVSCGISTAVCQVDMNEKALLDNADQALYHSKEAGRNQVTIFGKETTPGETT